MAATNIPLFKVFVPATTHAALKPVLESGRLAAGPQVAAFEHRLASWLGAPGAVALSDASAALTLALYMAGVRPGDEVITASLACSATVMPIANLFARPVWCDVDPLTGMMDADKIAGLISPRTRAILFYHWSGDVGAIESVVKIARDAGVKVIEDASEALGATLHGKRLGGLADFTIYSFYATKHINTGEGAVLLAADPDDLPKARTLRRYGIDYAQLRLANGDLNPHFDIALAGFNFPMNELAATMGLEAMTQAEDIVVRHRNNGSHYEAALAHLPGLRLLQRRVDATSAYWTYTLLAERRDDLIHSLVTLGIAAQRLHLRNDGFSCFGGKAEKLPGTGEFDAQNLSIPCGWWLSEDDRERIVDCIRAGW